MMRLLAVHEFDPISNIVLEIGNFTWAKYSLMILIGIIIAVVLGKFEGKKLGIKWADLVDGILIIVPLSIVGTRLWYVIFEFGNRYLPTFQNDGFIDGMIKVINISDGGLAIHGGFITAFISAYFYTKRRGINFFSAFDIMVPGFLIAQASGRWGNFFNQEAHGGVIGGVDEATGAALLTLDEQRAFLDNTLNLPKFISDNMLIKAEHAAEGTLVPNLTTADPTDMINAVYYHPTFLYESVWNVIGFIIILLFRRTKWMKNGEALAFYLIWYGIGRFFIEAMRTDSLYVLDTGIRTAQLISIIMIIGGLVYIYLVRKVFKNKAYYEVLRKYEGIDVDGDNKPNKHTRIFKEDTVVEKQQTSENVPREQNTNAKNDEEL